MVHVQGKPEVIIGLLGQLRATYKYKAATKSHVKGDGLRKNGST